ncbi:Piwi domain-containing protein [Rhizophagus irregularis DAOM 181602=DAOM 197198]|nr:Piwi domain-containing protein [Rhizophagus irregularis DAOM 181602=DAOM 197198]
MEDPDFQLVKEQEGRANMFAHKQLRFEDDSFDVELEEEDTPVNDMTNNCLMATMAMDIIIGHKISATHQLPQEHHQKIIGNVTCTTNLKIDEK